MKLSKTDTIMILLAIGFLVFIFINTVYAQVKTSYQQVTKGLSQYIKLNESSADSLFSGALHYGAIDNNEVGVFITVGGKYTYKDINSGCEVSGYDKKVHQVMMVFMEGNPPNANYDGRESSKYVTLVSNVYFTVMTNIFPQNDGVALTWARNCRQKMQSDCVEPGTIFKKTFEGKTVQVYRVFMPQLKQGFNVVSIT